MFSITILFFAFMMTACFGLSGNQQLRVIVKDNRPNIIGIPMIAFWPRGIKTKRGSITGQPGHVMDFMATFIELAQTTYPSAYGGQAITPIDGVSLLPISKGQKRNGHKAYFNEHNNRRYARMGDWKIVSSSTDTTWRLFNMHDDATETTNVANVHPEIVAQLNGLWHTWAPRNKVYPKPVK